MEDRRSKSCCKTIKGKKISKDVNAMVVPGSGLVKIQAERGN